MALKKLAVPEARLLDYQECKARVEKMAAENRGADRLEAMRRWVEVQYCTYFVPPLICLAVPDWCPQSSPCMPCIARPTL